MSVTMWHGEETYISCWVSFLKVYQLNRKEKVIWYHHIVMWGRIMPELTSCIYSPARSPHWLWNRCLSKLTSDIRLPIQTNDSDIPPSSIWMCFWSSHEYQPERNILLRLQRHSAITLLYNQRIRGASGDYRPIALLCVDVKVLLKVPMHPLQRFLHNWSVQIKKLLREEDQCFTIADVSPT